MTEIDHPSESTSGLIKASTISLIIVIVAYFLNYGVNVVLARWLGVVIYGDFAAAINSLQVTSLFVLLGMDYAVVRFVPEYVSTGNWSAASGYLQHNFGLLLRVGLSVFAAGLLIAASLHILNKHGIFTFEASHPFFLFIWAIPLVAFNTYLSKLLCGTKQVYLSLISLIIALPVILYLILALCMFFTHQVNIYQAMFGFVLSLVVVLAGQAIVAYFSLPRQILHSKPIYKRMWTRVAFDLLLTSFLTANLTFLVVVLSEIFDPIEKHTGILYSIFTICYLLWLISAGIVTVMSPLISPAMRKKDQAKLQRLVNVGNLAMLTAALLLLLVVIFFGKNILAHFGSSFVMGYPALVLFTAVSTFSLMSGMSIPLLQFSGHEKIIVKITIFGTILLVSLCAFLSRYYGLMGSVIAACTVQVILSLWCSFWVRKKLGIKPFILF